MFGGNGRIEKRTSAWIGDAVLALSGASGFCVSRIYSPKADRSLYGNDIESFPRLPRGTDSYRGKDWGDLSNRIESAFAYIEEMLLPVFEKQRRNQIKMHGSWRTRVQ